jgi:hypothetical protein
MKMGIRTGKDAGKSNQYDGLGWEFEERNKTVKVISLLGKALTIEIALEVNNSNYSKAKIELITRTTKMSTIILIQKNTWIDYRTYHSTEKNPKSFIERHWHW